MNRRGIVILLASLLLLPEPVKAERSELMRIKGYSIPKRER